MSLRIDVGKQDPTTGKAKEPWPIVLGSHPVFGEGKTVGTSGKGLGPVVVLDRRK